MSDIRIEKILEKTNSLYEAAVLASLEARRLNSVPKVRAGTEGKITSVALQRLVDGQIRYERRRRGESELFGEEEEEEEGASDVQLLATIIELPTR